MFEDIFTMLISLLLFVEYIPFVARICLKKKKKKKEKVVMDLAFSTKIVSVKCFCTLLVDLNF